MPLGPGIYINAFPVAIAEEQEVTRIPLDDSNPERRALEREHHTSLFLDDGAAWTAKPVNGQPRTTIRRDERLAVHLFNLREALRRHAHVRGWDFWVQRGEMSVVKPDIRETVGPFAIQSVLKLRAVWEGLAVKELLLVASSSVRWLVDLPLNDASVAQVSVGEFAMRRSSASGRKPRRGKVDRIQDGEVYLVDRAGGRAESLPAEDYQLVARPALVHRLLLAQGKSYSEASHTYSRLLAASGTLRREDNRTPNPFAAKTRYENTEGLLDDFGRELTLANGTTATIAQMPREIFPVKPPAQEAWMATTMTEPKLRFDPVIPSRVDTRAYQGLRRYGAYRSLDLDHAARILLAYPSAAHQQAERFGQQLINGSGSYPGFARMFGLAAELQPTLDLLRLPSGQQMHDLARLRSALDRWAEGNRQHEPDLALVIVPHTDRWLPQTPYYVSKQFFAQRGIPSQMVTEELLHDTGRLGWSLANIALAAFAKLGGTPWVVDARGQDADLVIGVGRSDIMDGDGGRRQTFGYAVAFVSNGSYLATHSRAPATDITTYEQRLTEAIAEALQESREADVPTTRIIIHLASRTGERELAAATQALKDASMEDTPVAFLRIDDSSLFEMLNGLDNRYAPEQGLTLRLGDRRALVQVESATAFGPARRPLLIEFDPRSTVDQNQFGSLVLGVYRLGHANWRGFNARSKPVTLLYGERLAELVGYMSQGSGWSPAAMRPELRRRPWFL